MSTSFRRCCLLLAFGTSMAAGGVATFSQQVFRSSIRTVAIHATVVDRAGRPVMSLKQEDFEILDDGRPVASTVFTTSPQALTLLMMFDTSASVAPDLRRVREAARTAVSALGSQDRASIGTFGHEIAVNPHLTGDKEVLARVIREEVWPGLKTRLWDALSLALRQLANDSGRRALIVLSDGRDSSTIGSGQMAAARTSTRSLALRDDWTVYAVNVGTAIDRQLTEIVDDTGGRAVRLRRASELAGAFAGFMEELRHQYLLGIPAEEPDGRLHRIEVRVRRPHMTVRARQAYQAEGGSK